MRKRLQDDIYYVKKPFNEDELYSLVTSCEKLEHPQALRESEGNYRRVLEQSNEGILTVDFQGNITFANATFATMFGYDLESIKDRSLLISSMSPMQIGSGNASPAAFKGSANAMSWS
jgi:PAS domain-containing protein